MVVNVIVRRAFTIIADVIARRAITIIIAHCAVAIIVNKDKMPVHWPRQRRHRNKGNNAIVTMAESVASSK